ncbi:bifunctional adenosylcobinamide kinase/adenosylcobinamide-phosphate guanylyltransferase [Kineosporia babensis]|uniref:Adenosylcobinamide kinase n=1 Tax=Kineosporia babensis TaxID=499548 RepID=A0A9X1ND50_9ACTN|nr:bifunctional adenosylcobinamide kinase/adenosylcobinamide-phosphate guanylyltransferase [Kineosporia babensis]MCD5311569.1 bifunctional adenosylcobinamide kinase/adenosylcobinamide-phosphate guanylyltransferase [Kineosporia babensis]
MGTVVWAPQVGEPDDVVVEALNRQLGGQAPRAIYLGPVPNAAADDGEMPSVGCARTLARLRAAGVIGPGTRCVLLGFGHRETHPARLAACLPVWGAELGALGQTLDLESDGAAASSAAAVARVGATAGRVLVLGGSGSGKSAFAEQMLSAAPEVVYLATGPKPTAAEDVSSLPGPDDEQSPTEHPEDDEWNARVRKHQDRRPAWWSTLETIDVVQPLAEDGRAILLDSVGTWLSGVLDRCGAWDDRPGWREQLDADVEELLQAWTGRSAPLVAVSDEVGWSIVPATESGRLFRDQLGRLNAKLADASEDVFVVVAGRLLRTDP